MIQIDGYNKTAMYLDYKRGAIDSDVTVPIQTNRMMEQHGYTHYIVPQDMKTKGQRIMLNGVGYRLASIYVLSEPIHGFSDPDGEIVLEHKPETRGHARVMVCIPVRVSTTVTGVDDFVLGHECLLQEVIDSYLVGGGGAKTYGGGTIVVMSEPVLTSVPLHEFRGLTGGHDIGIRGIRKERNDSKALFDTVFDFPYGSSEMVEIDILMDEGSFENDSTVALVGSTKGSLSTTGSLSTGSGNEILEGFQEGVTDLINNMNNNNLGAGFGTFSSTIQQSGQTFNQAGQDYVYDFSKKKETTGDTKTTTVGDFVDCVPIYDNTDQISTFVIPYGSTITDDATRLFMTGTFQMFYTLLVAFVILFLTPVLYKGYFAVAMRRGNTDDIEYGNKLTYSANFYFVLYSVLMIIGVLIDASVYTQSTTELGFAIMLMVFFVCTYMFTLMLRSAGFDRSVYGDLNTKYSMSEILGIYSQFMIQYTDIWAVMIPIILIGIVVGITIGAYRNKTGTGDYPFSSMIAMFFIGLYLVLSTMGAFVNKWRKIRSADALQPS